MPNLAETAAFSHLTAKRQLAQRIEDEHRAVGGTIVWDQAFLVAGQVTD
jgi:hypothetical protein